MSVGRRDSESLSTRKGRRELSPSQTAPLDCLGTCPQGPYPVGKVEGRRPEGRPRPRGRRRPLGQRPLGEQEKGGGAGKGSMPGGSTVPVKGATPAGTAKPGGGPTPGGLTVPVKGATPAGTAKPGGGPTPGGSATPSDNDGFIRIDKNGKPVVQKVVKEAPVRGKTAKTGDRGVRGSDL